MSEPEWRRVHPATLGFEFLIAIRQVFFAIILVRLQVDRNEGLASFLEYIFVLLAFGSAVVRWYTTRYLVDDEVVRYERGLIRRLKQVMPRDRVQNVSRSTPFLARFVGMSQLQISDASGGDITVGYLDEQEAERLAVILDPRVQGVQSDVVPAPPGAEGPDASAPADGAPPAVPPRVDSTQPPVPPSAPSRMLAAPGLGNVILARFATTSATTLSVAVPILAFLLFVAVRSDLVDPSIGGFDSSWFAVGGLAPLFVVGSIVFAALNGVLALGRFQLTTDDSMLRVTSGLLSEQRLSARPERVQTVTVERSPLSRWLGLERVRFETADLESLGGGVTNYLSPAEPIGSWPRLADAAFGPVGLAEADLQPVSPLTVRRARVRYSVTALVVIAVATALDLVSGVVGLALAAPTVWWFADRRFALLGYAVDGRHLMVRDGVLFQRVSLMNLDKIQKIELSSTYFQRRLDLATVRVIAAGRSERAMVTIPDLDRNVADDLAGLLIRHSRATPLELII